MLDAWEIIGRMLTDDDFRASVYKAAPRKHPAINKTTRAEFAERDFTRMRDAVTAVIKDRPVSLAGLGEILWPLVNNTRAFRDSIKKLTKIIEAGGVDTERDDPYFYVALGAMVVDPNLRGTLISESPFTPFDDFGFTSLSEDDRAALVSIFSFMDPRTVSAEAAADSASNDICETEWGSDCFLRTVWWEYPPLRQRGMLIRRPHSHPVPLPSPPSAARKK